MPNSSEVLLINFFQLFDVPAITCPRYPVSVKWKSPRHSQGVVSWGGQSWNNCPCPQQDWVSPQAMLSSLALADGVVMSRLIKIGKNKSSRKMLGFFSARLVSWTCSPREQLCTGAGAKDKGSDHTVRSSGKRKRREKGKWGQAVRYLLTPHPTYGHCQSNSYRTGSVLNVVISFCESFQLGSDLLVSGVGLDNLQQQTQNPLPC